MAATRAWQSFAGVWAARLLNLLCVAVFFGMALRPNLALPCSLLMVAYLPNVTQAWTASSRHWSRSSDSLGRCQRCDRSWELPAMIDGQSGLCRPCERALQRQPGLRFGAMFASLALTGLIFLGIWPPLGWVLANLSLFLVLDVVAMSLHELGHALMAVLQGDKLLSLHFGGGNGWVCGKLGSIWIYLHRHMSEGLTVALPRSAAGFRLKSILFGAAGPAVNILIGLLLWPRVQAKPDWSLSASWLQGFDLELNFFYINLALAINSLVPHDVKLDTGAAVPSDGKLIVGRLVTSRAASPKLLDHVTLLAGELYRFYENPEAELEVLKIAALHHPPDRARLTDTMLLLLIVERTAEALELAHRLEQQDEARRPEVKGIEANNLGWCYFLAGQLGSADRLSAQAVELLPSCASALGTRGQVLLALGHFEEARDFLWRAVRGIHHAKSAASNLEAVVRLAALEGDPEEFIRCRELALLLWPTLKIPASVEEQVAEVKRKGHCLTSISLSEAGDTAKEPVAG